MDIDPEIKYVNTNIPVARPNILNAVWGAIMLAFVIFSIVVAVSKHKKAKPEEKQLLRAILLETAGTFALLFGSQYFTVNVLKTPALNSYGPLFTMPLVIGTGYAITKFRLFNIKAITTELVTFGLWLFLLLRLLFSNSTQDYVVNATVLLGVVVIGVFLIKSVLIEVKQKEELAKVNTKLEDLNEHLEQKVTEQTVEIRRAYEVEKEARIELQELDKKKNQFILTTQHNLRTPLTIIIGYLESLRKSITSKNITEDTVQSVNKANEAADRLGHLTNELLNITEMQIGEKVLKKE